MSETPKKPGEDESTLSNAAPPAWQTVAPPASSQWTAPPQVLPPPPAGGYPGSQGYLPPPPASAAQAGYRPVYDGGAPSGAPPNAGYGAPPPNYPPGYGGQPPPYGYPQNTYGQTNMAAEMLAMAVLMRRRRRWRRHFVLWPVLFFVFFTLFVLHGCASFVRGF